MSRNSEPALLFSNRSDVGQVREVNEDYHGYCRVGDWHVFMLADGMGGEVGGQQASRLAVNTVQATFEEHSDNEPVEILHRAIQSANLACLDEQKKNPELSGMGTTLDVLVVNGGRAWWGHVGDSRIYLIRDGQSHQVTKDHTQVQAMLDGNLLTPAEAAEHPRRHVLNRVVGRQPNLVPDVSTVPIELQEDDALVMCSDGVTDLVSEVEIADLVLRYGPDRACKRLIELTNKRGGPDNATLQVIFRGQPKARWRVTSVGQANDERNKPKIRRIWLAAAAALFMALAGVGLMTPHRSENPAFAQETTASRVAEPGTEPSHMLPSLPQFVTVVIFPGTNNRAQVASERVDGEISDDEVHLTCQQPDSRADEPISMTLGITIREDAKGMDAALLTVGQPSSSWQLRYVDGEFFIESEPGRAGAAEARASRVHLPSNSKEWSLLVSVEPTATRVDLIDAESGNIVMSSRSASGAAVDK